MVDRDDDGEQRTINERVGSGERRPPRDAADVGGDRYRLLELLGRGGMGEVLTARDEQLGRDVAVKRMLADGASDETIDRFLREARVQGRLDHPAIVPVHELGRDTAGLPYFVMKKVSGTTLADIIKSGTDVPRQRLLRAFVDVCLAVEFAHVRGILHRDLKPANIVLGEYGEVYVLDWGVAKVIGETDAVFADVGRSSGSGSGSGSGGHATVAGTVIGTPGYIAPEQVRGVTDIDARADVYALGCMLFEILAGRRLHPDGFDGLDSAVSGVDARPSACAPDRDVPPELDLVCVEATRIERDARIASARELGAHVERYLDGDRDLAARRDLARIHLEHARTAFARRDDDGDARRTAMHEAGRALALDPSLAPAAELVTRLMLEPPKVVPREVAAEIAAQERVGASEFFRIAVWVFVGFLAFTPFLWWIAPSHSEWVATLTVMIAGCLVVNWVAERRATPVRVFACLVVVAITVAVVSRMYSPFLIAPGLGSLIVMATTITTILPVWMAATVIPLMMGFAIVGPWLAERFDLLSRTTTVAHHGVIMLHVAAVADRELPILGVAALYTGVLIAAASLFGIVIRIRDRALKERLNLQAWQLRQLVER